MGGDQGSSWGGYWGKWMRSHLRPFTLVPFLTTTTGFQGPMPKTYHANPQTLPPRPSVPPFHHPQPA